jgi:hypothetical protein
MNITINLEALTPGDLMQMGIFLLALSVALIAMLDMLKLTSFFKNTRTSPEILLICVVPILAMPAVSAFGNAISSLWGDVLPVALFFFVYGSVLLSGRNRNAQVRDPQAGLDASK